MAATPGNRADGPLHRSSRADPGRFEALSGMAPADFDRLVEAVRPRLREAEGVRLGRGDRRRAIGAGPPFGLDLHDQVFMALIRARHRPTLAGLSARFGISLCTAMRALHRLAPILAEFRLEAAEARRGHRRSDDLLRAPFESERPNPGVPSAGGPSILR